MLLNIHGAAIMTMGIIKLEYFLRTGRSRAKPHGAAIMTMGIIKLEYFLLNLDWAVFESTTIRTAAEGVKISV